MTDLPELSIEIIEIEPEAVYKDTVYDQTVIGQIQDGRRVELFDSSASVSEDSIGEVLDTLVHAMPKSHGERKVLDKSLGFRSSENPSTKWSYDLVGKIADIDLDEGTLALNIGSGEILVKFYNETEAVLESTNASIDDCLHIPDCRIDIFDTY